MNAQYYVLLMRDDIEPELHGPFKHEKFRDACARRLRAVLGDEHGAFPMDISAAGVLSVGTYSGGFFMEDET